MSTLTAVSQQYVQSVRLYFGAKMLSISYGGGTFFHFQQLIKTVTKLKWENKAKQNKTKKTKIKNKKFRLDCADLDKQKPHTILERTRTDDISFRQARTDCIVFNLRELEFGNPLFLRPAVVLTHCQTCVLNSLS